MLRPGSTGADQCWQDPGRVLYPDPSRGRGAAGTHAGGRDDRVDLRDSVGAGGWPGVVAAGAGGAGTALSSTRARDRRIGTARTPRRTPRRDNGVEAACVARPAPSRPAGGTGQGGHFMARSVSWFCGLLAGGRHRNPDRCERSGFRFSAHETDSLTDLAAYADAPSARMMLAHPSIGESSENYGPR